MENTSTPQPDPAAGKIAAWSAVIGLLTVLLVAAFIGLLSPGDRTGGETIFGALGLVAVVAAPFVAVLVSFRLGGLAMRRWIWLASGLLSFILAALTLFSGLWIVFGPVGVGLLAAWWMARRA